MSSRARFTIPLLLTFLGGLPAAAPAQDEAPVRPAERPTQCQTPVLGGVAPVFGAPGTPVVINGNNLDGTTAVTFGGASVPFSVVPPDRIETRVPQLLPGQVVVTVSKPCGSASLPFQIVEPAQSCVLGVVPSSLAFTAVVGDTEVPPQTLSLSSFQPGVSFTVQETSPFLDIGTAFGITPAQLLVRADPTGLPLGGFSAILRIACSAGGGGAFTVPVTLSVVPAPLPGVPVLTSSPASLTYVTTQGVNAPPQNLMVRSSQSRNGLEVDFVAANPISPRVQASPSSGRTPQTIGVSVMTADLAPSTYDFTLLLAPLGVGLMPTAVPLRVIVTQPPPGCSVVASPSSLFFTADEGGLNPPAQNVSLTSPQGAVAFLAAGGPPLVSVSTTSGNTPASLSVSISTTGLAAGTYTGMAAVGCASAGLGALQPIAVTVTVTAPGGELRATPSMLAFTGTRGGANPPAQALSVTSTGAPLSFTAAASGSFLSVAPSSGTTPASLSISADLAGLVEGSYSGTIMLASPGKPSVGVPVQLTVVPPPSLLMVSPSSLTFTTSQDVDPPSRTLTILSSGAPLNWSVSSVGSFLDVGPTSGTTPGSTFVAPRAVGLFPGTYSGSVIVTAPGTGSLNVPVTLVVTPTQP